MNQLVRHQRLSGRSVITGSLTVFYAIPVLLGMAWMVIRNEFFPPAGYSPEIAIADQRLALLESLPLTHFKLVRIAAHHRLLKVAVTNSGSDHYRKVQATIELLNKDGVAIGATSGSTIVPRPGKTSMLQMPIDNESAATFRLQDFEAF